MTGRARREDALIAKARICHAFHIGWQEYGLLTRGEQRVLLEMLAPPDDPESSEVAAGGKPPAPPGMERIL